MNDKHVRISKEAHARALRLAEDQMRTIGAVIHRALELYEVSSAEWEREGIAQARGRLTSGAEVAP